MTAGRKMVAWSAGIGVLAAFPFLALPRIDPAIVEVFYVAGEGFPLARVPLAQQMSGLLRILAVATGIAILLLLLARSFGFARRRLPSGAVLVYLVATLLIGPGLLINGVLKSHWDRARPIQTVEFGGDKTFSPALVISDQCERNCSFVSGDASVGFYLAAFGLAFARWRRRLIAGGLLAGVVIGIGRVAKGAHYPSDIVYAGVFTCLVAGLLYVVLVERARGRSAAQGP